MYMHMFIVYVCCTYMCEFIYNPLLPVRSRKCTCIFFACVEYERHCAILNTHAVWPWTLKYFVNYKWHHSNPFHSLLFFCWMSFLSDLFSYHHFTIHAMLARTPSSHFHRKRKCTSALWLWSGTCVKLMEANHLHLQFMLAKQHLALHTKCNFV